MKGQSPKQKLATKRNWLKGLFTNFTHRSWDINNLKLLSPEDYHDYLRAVHLIDGILRRWDSKYVEKTFASKLKVRL